MKRFNFFNVAFILGIVFLSFVSSNAAVIESNSGTTGDRTWNNEYVWVGDVVPSSTDTVIINGLVTVDIESPATFTSCGKLTVNSGAILRDWQGSELHVNGDMINNGTIENSYDGYYYLWLKVSGDITNNGTWKNSFTYLNGAVAQHLSATSEFSGGNFISENSADTLVVDSDLSFNNTYVDLNNDELRLQGNKLSIKNGYIEKANINGDNGELYMNGSWYDGAYSHNACLINSTVSNNITLTGIAAVNSGVVFKGTVIVEDTLQNDFYNPFTLQIDGDIINNGLIRDANQSCGLTLNIDGNVTNNGEWTNHTTNLSGSNAQHLTFSRPFSGYYLYDTDSSSSILADSDLHFHNCHIDLDSAEFDLQGHQLSFTGDYATYPYDLRSATIVANGGSLFLNSYVYLYKTVLDGITLRGEVKVTDVIFEGTTVVEDTLENGYLSSGPIDINGDIINNGLIRNSLTLNIDGNMTNNGEWTNHTTNLSGSNAQHLTFSRPFSGYYLYDTDSSSSILADSDLHFHNCHIDLDSAEFDLQGHQLSFTGDYATYPYDLRSATIVANGGSLFLNSYVYLYKTILDGITLRGEVKVTDVIFEGTTVVEDTLENGYLASGPIDINGDIINNGLIRNSLTLNIDGNMTNNGEWTNHTTNLSGSNAQHLTFSCPFSGHYLYDTDSSSSILADSDLHFHNCYVDLDSAEFDLQGHQLSFTGDYVNYPYNLKNATIIANGGSLFLNSYVYLYKTILDGITLRGEVQVKDVIFEGTTVVEDTLENYYEGSGPIDINGNIINNGLIRNWLTLNIDGDMTNNGKWTNSLTELKGDTKQHIIIENNQTIENQVKLNAMLLGDTYQWLLDDVEIANATSQILTFNSIGEAEFGHYLCRILSSGKETNYSRIIRISNGSPELSALPDTNFIEDHSLKLPVSFLFDYVEDPNDADSTLIWMIEDNDNVVTEIIADTISFSSTTNWFGVDTLSVIVSDGELADTTDMIVIVEPENDAPVIVALPDTSVFEDDSLGLELSAFDVDNDTLEFSASSDTAAIELQINQNLLTLIPIENWSGNSAIQVIVTDGELNDTTDFTFSVIAVNDPPAAFSLIAPADSTINNSDTVMVFQWENSTDTEHDTLSYGIFLRRDNFEYVTDCDTSYINLNILDIAVPRDVCINWSVYATDNIDTTWSNEIWHFTVSGQVGIEAAETLPCSYALKQNFPNPFNPTTTLRFAVPEVTNVQLVIYDIMGREILTLVDGMYAPGWYNVHWSGKTNSGKLVSTGIYLALFRAGDFTRVIKMAYVK